jgi:hypothetical protein
MPVSCSDFFIFRMRSITDGPDGAKRFFGPIIADDGKIKLESKILNSLQNRQYLLVTNIPPYDVIQITISK